MSSNEVHIRSADQDAGVSIGRKYRRILIVLMGSLGDVARGLGVVRVLKKADATCQVSWLVEPACYDLVRLHPDIDEILVFERPRGWRAIAGLIGKLRRRRFDLVLDLQRHLKSGFFSRMTGAPRRIGFHPRDSKEFNWIFQTEYIERKGEKASKFEHYMAFLDALCCERPPHPDFGIRDAVAGMRPLIPERHRPYVVFVLGSRWASKDWPREGYEALAREVLTRSGLSIVLVGGPAQATAAAQVADRLTSERLIDQTGKTTVSELARTILDARAVVGPDSGPGHLAAALGVPYISLFGPTAPGRTAPYGNEDLVVQARVACAPCYRRKCPGLDALCMRLISPRSVVERLAAFY